MKPSGGLGVGQRRTNAIAVGLWESAIDAAREALGVSEQQSAYVRHTFVDVRGKHAGPSALC